MTITTLIFMALASFRLTRLVVNDKITEPLRAPFFREVTEDDGVYLHPKGFIGNLISCHWCTGIWASVGLYVLYTMVPLVGEPVVFVLAIAALAALIQWVMDHV